SDGLHAAEIYDGVFIGCTATSIYLFEDGQIVDGIDFTVIVGGSVSGTVSAENGGAPVANVEVEASAAGALRHTAKTLTDASGHYTLTGLAPTSYYITFTPEDSPDDFLTEGYNDERSPPGDPVRVTL